MLNFIKKDLPLSSKADGQTHRLCLFIIRNLLPVYSNDFWVRPFLVILYLPGNPCV